MKLQVGVKALIRNDTGKFLFLQRSKPLQTGEAAVWDIPGGRLEADGDKSLVDALAREILEETGLKMTGHPSLAAGQDILDREADLHVVRLTYFAEASGNVKLSEAHDNFKWLPVSKATNLKTDPYLQAVVQNLAHSGL